MASHMRYKQLWQCTVHDIRKFILDNRASSDPDMIKKVNHYKEVLYIMGRYEEEEQERVRRSYL